MYMFKKILFIIDLWRAYSLASSNIDKALFLLNKNINEIEKHKNKFPDYYILKGSLNYDKKNYSEAQKDLEIATVLLTKNKYYNLDEIKYLYSFIYLYLSDILYKKDDDDWKLFYDLHERKNFDIKKIRKNLKNNFPLS